MAIEAEGVALVAWTSDWNDIIDKRRAIIGSGRIAIASLTARCECNCLYSISDCDGIRSVGYGPSRYRGGGDILASIPTSIRSRDVFTIPTWSCIAKAA